MLVVILTSLFPLPLDKLRDWIVNKTNLRLKSMKMLPCSKLNVVDVWSIKLPKLTSESPIRVLDVNEDGVEDILFGFGTGEKFLSNCIAVVTLKLHVKYRIMGAYNVYYLFFTNIFYRKVLIFMHIRACIHFLQ